MGKVAVVGSINTDLNVLSSRLPSPGETVIGGEFFQAPGGKGANQAVAAARAGAEVVMLGAVGRDAFGDAALETLRNDGVDTTHLRRADVPSGVALIMIGADGENLIAVAPGANHAVVPADVDRALNDLAGCGTVLLQLELKIDVVWHAARVLAARGARVILNPAPAPEEPIPEDVLQSIDVIVPNEGELARLVGRSIPPGDEEQRIEAARVLIGKGVRQVVVTLGPRGVLLVDSEEASSLPGFSADAVDTVGAGDCFCGALAAALAEGMGFEEAIRFAQAAAAISVTRRGAQPSMPHRSEIEAFLSR